MRGKLFVGILLAFCVVFGAGLYWFQNYAYYGTTEGLTEVEVYGDFFPVSDYQGIDAETSPLKMRACFTVDWDYAPSLEYREMATPLTAPGWFDCFDAEQITDDIRLGIATVYLAEPNDPYGFDRFIAHYEDGDAFMWRQINGCGEAAFKGDPLPPECPPEPET